MSDAGADLLVSARSAWIEGMQSELLGAVVNPSDPKLMRYLMASMGGLPDEAFRVLFLDGASRLIADEQLQYGALGQLALYPRTIFRRAMEHNSAGLILVHNHPSGDPTPSESDIAVTRMLAGIARSLEIRIIDHIIVTSQLWERVPLGTPANGTALLLNQLVSPLSDVLGSDCVHGQTDIDTNLLRLNEKHLEVLRGIADLKTSKEIARDLNISRFTVDQRVKKIVAVLGVRTRNEAAKLYWKVRI